MTKERALELIRRGKIGAYIIAGVSASVLVLAFLLGADLGDRDVVLSGALILIANSLIMGAIGYGFQRRSRLAGVIVLLTLVSGVASNENFFTAEAWNVGPATILLAALFVWIWVVFLQATYGTFAYHRRMKEEDPSHSPTRAWHVVVGSVAGLIIFVIVGIDLSERFGLTNSSRVIAGDTLSASDLAELVDYEIVKPTDTVKLIYAPTLFSVSAEGLLITEESFIAYEGGGPFDSVYIYEIPLRDISQVDVLSQGTEFTDTVVEITFTDESYVEITLPVTDGGDAEFITLLRSQINAGNEAAS